MPRIGSNPETSRNVLSALQTGEQMTQRERERASAEQDARSSGLRQQGLQAGQLMQQKQQQDVENSQRQQQLDEQGRSNRMREAIAQDEQDVTAGAHGVERQGPSRADTLRQEMERGRLQTQMNKPLEVPGATHDTVPGQEVGSVKPTARALQEKTAKAMTERMNAEANLMNARRGLEKARMAGDKEAEKSHTTTLLNQVKSANNLYQDARKESLSGGGLSEDQWENLQSIAEGNPDQGLQQEIQKREIGPRTLQFLKNRSDISAVDFIATTGELPSGDLVDTSSPAMQQLTQTAASMKQKLQELDAFTGGLFSQMLDVNNVAERNRSLNRMSARALKQMMANPSPAAQPGAAQQGAAGDLGEGMTPSLGGQQNVPLGTPGANGVPGAARPNADLDNRSATQQRLQQQEQRRIDEQQRSDNYKRSPSYSSGRGFYGVR